VSAGRNVDQSTDIRDLVVTARLLEAFSELIERPDSRSIELGIGAPGETRTHGLQVRNLTLYPLSYGRIRYRILGVEEAGGEGGIRTLGAAYATQRFSKPPH
jgi:hypothetical protein